MTEDRLPWPRTGDRLFVCGADWWHNACLWMSDNTCLIRDGYRTAAQILVQRVMDDRICIDALIYPIAFLYRHTLELTLKRVAENGCALLSRECPDLRGHSLSTLWGKCRGIIEEVWAEGDKADLDAVEECIHQLDEIDATSQTFRYSETTKGERPLDGMKHINIRNFAEVLERMSTFLECCENGISMYLQDSLDNGR